MAQKDLSYRKITVKTPYGTKTFIFNTRRHFRGDDNTAMQRIADWIVNNADSPAWMKGPLWFVLNLRIAQIYPSHELWDLLDNESQHAGSRNYLMWKGHIKNSNTITVTHFGPLGKGQEKKMTDDFNNYRDQFFINICAKLGIRSMKDLDNMTERERESKTEEIRKIIRLRYLKIIKDEMGGMIEELKAALKTTIEAVFGGTLKEGTEITAMLAVAGLAPTAVKLMLKEVTVIVTKQIAKEIAVISAKLAGKQGSKSVAKKIPIVGAAVGLGLGLWRLSHGDFDGALLETASGIASTAPGLGTVASVALDVGIAGRDIKHALDLLYARRDRFLQQTNDLNEQLSKVEKLKRAYGVIERAFDEFDFEDDADDFLQAIKYIVW